MPYRSRRELSERVRRIDNPRSLLRDAFIVRAVCAPTAAGHANTRANSERCWVGALGHWPDVSLSRVIHCVTGDHQCEIVVVYDC